MVLMIHRGAAGLGTRHLCRSFTAAGLSGVGGGIVSKALPACENTTSPRTWALALLGVHEYLRRMGGDRVVSQTGERLAEKLVNLYDRTASDDWPWFEDVAAYNNARLSQALILSGSWSENPRVTAIGIESLRWLCGKQLSPEGRFRPIGCNGFCRQGVPTAIYDQQAIEAHAMVSASIGGLPCASKTPFGVSRRTWHLTGS